MPLDSPSTSLISSQYILARAVLYYSSEQLSSYLHVLLVSRELARHSLLARTCFTISLLLVTAPRPVTIMSNNPFASTAAENPFSHPDDSRADPSTTHLSLLQSLYNAQATLTQNISDMSSVIAGLGNGSITLADRLSALESVASAPKQPPIPRFREPAVFTGSATEVETFLHSMTAAFALQGNSLPHDYAQAVYFSTYLGPGDPTDWFKSIELTKPNLLNDITGLFAEFRVHFGDPNLSATSLRKLQSLQQKGPCSQYKACFIALLAHVDLSEQSKIDMFKAGLKPDVRNALATCGRRHQPVTFSEFIEDAVDIDNELHSNHIIERTRAASNHANGNGHRSKSFQQQSTAPPPPSHPSSLLRLPHSPVWFRWRLTRLALGAVGSMTRNASAAAISTSAVTAE